MQKKIKEFISNISNAHRSLLTLLIASIQILSIFALFFHFFQPPNFQTQAIGDDKIRKKLQHLVQHCGSDHFWTWIIVDQKRNKYYFQDVIGCNKANKTNCAFSVKYSALNPFYLEPHDFTDHTSLELLSKLDTGMVAFYEDFELLKPYKDIYIALTSAPNKKLHSATFSVTKNSRRDLVYLFVKTSSSENSIFCQKNEAIELLEDLSIYAKGNLQ